jgi:ribosome-binding factor A
MPKEYSRTERIADLLQRELARLIQQEMQDPRLSLITVTSVVVSRDLAHAKIYITQLKEDPNTTEIIKTLNKAARHLRYLLAQETELRLIPNLKFFYDTSIGESSHLSALIDAAVAADQKKSKE